MVPVLGVDVALKAWRTGTIASLRVFLYVSSMLLISFLRVILSLSGMAFLLLWDFIVLSKVFRASSMACFRLVRTILPWTPFVQSALAFSCAEVMLSISLV